MWVELECNKFFNLDEAELMYAELNKEGKYDVKISPKRKHDVKHREILFVKNFNTFQDAIQYIRDCLKPVDKKETCQN